jgi:hypothetical protein
VLSRTKIERHHSRHPLRATLGPFIFLPTPSAPKPAASCPLRPPVRPREISIPSVHPHATRTRSTSPPWSYPARSSASTSSPATFSAWTLARLMVPVTPDTRTLREGPAQHGSRCLARRQLGKPATASQRLGSPLGFAGLSLHRHKQNRRQDLAVAARPVQQSQRHIIQPAVNTVGRIAALRRLYAKDQPVGVGGPVQKRAAVAPRRAQFAAAS